MKVKQRGRGEEDAEAAAMTHIHVTRSEFTMMTSGLLAQSRGPGVSRDAQLAASANDSFLVLRLMTNST